jgi:hypothetical protein
MNCKASGVFSSFVFTGDEEGVEKEELNESP